MFVRRPPRHWRRRRIPVADSPIDTSALEPVSGFLRRGLLQDASTALASAGRRRTRFHLLVEAELLQLTGQTAPADAMLRDLLATPGLSALERARALEISGAVASDRADVRAAIDLFMASAAAADEAGSIEQACRARLRLLPALAEASGPDAVASLVYELKPLVLRSGDPHLLAMLHLRAGHVEAKRGLPDRALEHLERGREILAVEPNAFIEGLLALNASVVASMLPHPAEAEAFARRALDCADRSGHVRTAIAARTNLSTIMLQRGNVAQAEHWAGATLCDAEPFPGIRSGLLDTCVSIELSRGRFESARALLHQVLEPGAPAGASTSWFHLATRATWLDCLEALEDWPEASKVASSATALADSRGDVMHRAWFRLRQAAVSLSMDEVPAAERLLASVLLDGHQVPRQAVPELHAALSRAFVRLGDGASAAAHARHAHRLVADAGSPFARQRITRSLPPAPAPADDERQAGEPARVALHVATSLVHYAGSPEFLGREAAGLLECLGGALETALVVGEEDDATSTVSRGAGATAPLRPPLVFPLGRAGHRRWELHVTPAPGLAAAVACDAVRRAVAAACELHEARREAKERVSLWSDLGTDTGQAEAAPTKMQALLATAHRVATAPVTVLITGETGVGKELIAEELHKRSGRAHGAFLAFNCTSVPRDMVESQLFGYRRGAFTDAKESFLGLLRAADGGTLFIDEIGELGLESQPKLLRFLESGEVHPLGETRPVKVDVRVVAATNAPLEHLLGEGRFREDLYYRLNVVRLRVPPLRERREEIPRLATLFLDRFAREMRKGALSLDEAALERLLLYAWPGNVRQLQNELRRIVALAAPGETIGPGHLSEEILAAPRSRAVAGGTTISEVVIPLQGTLEAATWALERAMIAATLARTGGHLDDAARLLGVSRKGLFLKRRRLELHDPKFFS
jgi:DNA-binding NtrC family response regulator